MDNVTIRVAALFCCCSVAWGSSPDKPIVHTLSGPRSQRDDIVEAQYRKSYTVVEIDQRRHKYEGPTHIGKVEPTQPVYVNGQCVSGWALVYVVVTNDGTIVSPYVLADDNPAFDAAAVDYSTLGRYQPAELDGAAISVIIGILVTFKCP